MIAAVNGTRLAYSDSGHGVPLVCLHGGMGVDSGALRVPGMLDLANCGVRLVIPDQRGHGASDRSSQSDYSHETWVTDAHELAINLALTSFALFGHSYGGFLALEYARRWPNSLTHLVLVATSAGPVNVGSCGARTDTDLREYFRGIWPQLFAGENKHWPLFESLRFAADPYNAAFTRELPAYDVRESIAALTVPTLLIVGSRDAYLPSMHWLADHLPNAVLRVLEGVGHFPFVEAAEQFTQLVADFITGHVDASASHTREPVPPR